MQQLSGTGHLFPNQMRYQAAPLPDGCFRRGNDDAGPAEIGRDRNGAASGGTKASRSESRGVAGMFRASDLAMTIFILDRLSGEYAPQIPGLYERVVAG